MYLYFKLIDIIVIMPFKEHKNVLQDLLWNIVPDMTLSQRDLKIMANISRTVGAAVPAAKSRSGNTMSGSKYALLPPSGKRIRKEYRLLTLQERERFHLALKKLYRVRISSDNYICIQIIKLNITMVYMTKYIILIFFLQDIHLNVTVLLFSFTSCLNIFISVYQRQCNCIIDIYFICYNYRMELLMFLQRSMQQHPTCTMGEHHSYHGIEFILLCKLHCNIRWDILSLIILCVQMIYMYISVQCRNVNFNTYITFKLHNFF